MLLSLFLLACGSGTSPGGDSSAPGDGDTGGSPALDDPCPDSLDWQTAAAPIVLASCATCHAAALADEARYGAPDDVDLDSLDAVRAHSERALARMQAGDMPPSSGLTELELARFAQWLDCGMPGESLTWPEVAQPPPAGTAGELNERVQQDGDEPELLELSAGEPDAAVPAWRELWLVQGQDLWLVARERYDTDGELRSADRWEPPIALLSGGEAATTTTTWRSHQDADGLDEWEERWEVEAGSLGLADLQLQRDPGALEVLALEDSGSELGLVLSEIYGPTQRWFIDAELGSLSVLQVAGEPPPEGADGSIAAGRDWIGRYFEREEP